jgi:hypothetical protein
MSEAPERIFLQDAGDYERAARFDVTWCVEPQDDADTEYVRADLAPDAAKVAALVEAGNRMANSIKGDYIHPVAATAWDAALAALTPDAAGKGGDA